MLARRAFVVAGDGPAMAIHCWGLQRGTGSPLFVAAASAASSTVVTTSAAQPSLSMMWRRGAVKKTGGSSKNGRTSRPKFLGPKKAHGEEVRAGDILLRQRGMRIHPGEGVERGRDFTLYATKPGILAYDVSNFPVPKRRVLTIIPLEVGLAHRLEAARNRPSPL